MLSYIWISEAHFILKWGAFLGAQWWGVHLPMQETWVWSLIWEDPTCHRATKPGTCNCWAHVPQLLKPACPRARALHQEQPPQWKPCTPQLESSPHSLQLGRSLCSNKDPAQPRINKIIYKKEIIHLGGDSSPTQHTHLLSSWLQWSQF